MNNNHNNYNSNNKVKICSQNKNNSINSNGPKNKHSSNKFNIIQSRNKNNSILYNWLSLKKNESRWIRTKTQQLKSNMKVMGILKFNLKKSLRLKYLI